MIQNNPSIEVIVDLTNPGQFFACCGLLELADRLWPGSKGWFEGDRFLIETDGELTQLIEKLSRVELIQIDPDDQTSSPIRIGAPFRELILDWWKDVRSGGADLKVWAGTMESCRIAKSMRKALGDRRFHTSDLLNIGVITYDVDNESKKVEPFYFDARRCPNAHSRDVGFSPNDLHMTTTAYPAVELLCLVGLQRFRPKAFPNNDRKYLFEYQAWLKPIPPSIGQAAASGAIPGDSDRRFRFENWYRTGQKKHMAFRSALPIFSRGE